MCMSDNKHVLLIHCKCGVSRSSTILLAWLVGVKKLKCIQFYLKLNANVEG